MTQYILKSALAAEIERRRKEWWYGSSTEAKFKKEECDDILSFLDTLEVKDVQEEPMSEDLEEAAKKAGQKYFPDKDNIWARPNYEAKKAECAFMEGAQWQKERFEKNRLEHCDSITEEQYNLECGFINQYLKKYHRTPTFLDAIEYGMKKQREITYETNN